MSESLFEERVEEKLEERAEEKLEEGYEKSEKILKDEDKIERLLQRIEHKLKVIPILGSKLADVPILASLVRMYVKKEYRDIPIGSVISIVSALLYFVSPIDLIPDAIPGIGYIDDAAVVAACIALVEGDLKEYQAWREKNGKIVNLETTDEKVEEEDILVKMARQKGGKKGK